MKSDFFELYNVLSRGVDSDEPILKSCTAKIWAMARTENSLGFAAMTEGRSIGAMYPEGLAGKSLRMAAKAVFSWNNAEASAAHAALNAYYNTAARMEALGSFEEYEKYSTDGIDFTDKTVGIVGHMHGPKGMREKAKQVFVIEREPQPGDYPDPACDFLLPQCDIVLITGSSLINKTLPHLLELCRDATTILTGPTVPMCPALLDFGIDRLAGLVVTDADGLEDRIISDRPGNPYGCGKSFLLKK